MWSIEQQEKWCFPAHFRKKDHVYQSLEAHLRQTAMRSAQYGKTIGFEKTAELVGLLHDMGKFTDAYRDYFYESVDRELKGEPRLNSEVDHGRHGAKFIYERYRQGDDDFRKITAEILAMVICYHHGGMEDFISDDGNIKLIRRINGDDGYALAVQRYKERVCDNIALDMLFNEAVEEFKRFYRMLNVEGKFQLHLLIKFLYSCLIDADYYDTYLFMVDQKAEETDTAALWTKFRTALAQKEAEFREEQPAAALERRIHTMRQDVLEECRKAAQVPAGIYTLTVPTGGGKTLSAMRFALERNPKKIFFIAPFIAILEQNADEVRSALQAGDWLAEHHSNVLTFTEKSSDDSLRSPGYLLTARWDKPIIFTTMVQFLQTFFAKGSRHMRRLHQLEGAVLIFDEVQAVPPKCLSLFNQTIKFLATYCGSTVVLCSATQPALEIAENPCPIDGELNGRKDACFSLSKRVQTIDWRENGRRMSIPELCGRVEDISEENPSILLVMNTRSVARRLFEKLRESQKLRHRTFFFLSTDLCPAHRREVIRRLKESLQEKLPVICVSTQIIEAGVNISFSCGIRHVAGLDSLTQTFGRVGRHGEMGIRKVYIVALEEEELGSLCDIFVGKRYTGQLLRKLGQDPAFDLFSPETIRRYFESYYQDEIIRAQMKYPVKTADGSIYEMLSSGGSKARYEEKYGEKSPMMLPYLLRSAANHFKVIDESEYAVLAPYQLGATLPEALPQSGDIVAYRRFLASARPYMVNLSGGAKQALERKNAIEQAAGCDILILKKAFYDEFLGVLYH